MTTTPSANYEGIAGIYDRRRPSYPEAAVAAVAAFARAATDGAATVLDVGCGTGIFTRLLAAALPAGFAVVGIEPRADMRAAAAARADPTGRTRFVAGRAEALPVAAGGAILATAATAVHWFDRRHFYAEAARALAPAGALAVVENKRRWWDSPALAAYEAILEAHVPGYRRGTHPDPAHPGSFADMDYVAELAAAPGFAPPIESTWLWQTEFTRPAFVEFARSSTIMQRAIARASAPVIERALEDFLDRHATGGIVVVPYRTQLVAARPAPR
jgi:ubiquinone/menaquinone biosynthesis C-methylase UbiE